ncbi:uncharacterized protein LOC108157547 [Drosophila miranda]|uniref:uncharacterized protein LOC108157547 n=1 Tax=Drosophila miranda TaxID=7229 RepID=UPI00143F7879|nr:uncharacterized protein LOC108157547 [Drosophila miranda]
MKTMSKNLFTGLMTRKGTATVHPRNYIFQKSFKARQVLMAKAKTNGAPEPETLEDQTPNQTQPESACPEMKTTGATALPLAENTRKTVSLKESFSDQRERWMARTKEIERKAMLAAKESPSKATRNKWSTPGKYDWQQQLSPQKKPNGDNEIISPAEGQRMFRTNRVHGSQMQKQKQTRFLEEPSGRQHARRDTGYSRYPEWGPELQQQQPLQSSRTRR